jgi:copper chaperone CopZ
MDKKTDLEKEVDNMKKTMIVEGMSCMHCSARVEKALNSIDGVKASVDLEKKTATIELSKEINDEVLIGAVTDSRAVIALGTPFLRTERGRGVPGTWKHLDRLSRMEWKFGPDTAEYRRTRLNLKTGEEELAESRAGTYRAASEKYEDGSFLLSFRDGSQAVVLPIVYRNLMYLFDLTPAKSLFSRTREPVTEAGRLTGGDPREKSRMKD